MAKVLVIAEIKQGVIKSSTAELLSKAKAIGAETAVAAIGSNIESLIPGLVSAGSDTQYVADDPGLELFSAGPYASCVVDAAKQFGANLIWFGFSESGKAVALGFGASFRSAPSSFRLLLVLARFAGSFGPRSSSRSACTARCCFSSCWR